MISFNRLGFFCMFTALAVGVSGFAQRATAIVIYQENFGGSSSAALNGKFPDTDNYSTVGGTSGNTWLAYPNFKQNGDMPTDNVSQGAWLPFVPQPANIYTLSISFTGVGPDGSSVSWVAFGFPKGLPTAASAASPSGQNRLNEGATLGRAWMLFRANNPTTPSDAPNVSHRGGVSSGDSPTTWMDSTLARAEGGALDLQIVLNTNPSTWTADFFAKRPTDTSYTDVSGGALPLTAQDIQGVGFVRTTGTITGHVTKFMLEQSDTTYVLGDVDGNGIVNDVDFGIIRDHLFQSGTRAQGDLTGDGFVDFSDFRQWKTAAGSGAGAGTSLNAAIPEPASVLLAMIAASVGCFAGRRHRYTTRQRNL